MRATLRQQLVHRLKSATMVRSASPANLHVNMSTQGLATVATMDDVTDRLKELDLKPPPKKVRQRKSRAQKVESAAKQGPSSQQKPAPQRADTPARPKLPPEQKPTAQKAAPQKEPPKRTPTEKQLKKKDRADYEAAERKRRQRENEQAYFLHRNAIKALKEDLAASMEMEVDRPLEDLHISEKPADQASEQPEDGGVVLPTALEAHVQPAFPIDDDGEPLVENDKSLNVLRTRKPAAMLPHPTQMPRPNQIYLELSKIISIRTDKPRRLLLVLDLNGTLGRSTNSGGFKPRPGTNEFLKYATKNHFVIIWSSAMPDKVQKRAIKLFGDADCTYPAIVWDRRKFCLSREQFKAHVQVFKRLMTVWDSAETKMYFPGTAWNATNTVLIDDNILKASTEPHNLIKIEEYLSVERDSFSDLGMVAQYLEELRWQTNVCNYIKTNPYRYDSVKAASFSWDSLLPIEGAPT